MELNYLEDIRDDVYQLINSMIEHNYGFLVGINRVIEENDYYMSTERPIEMACHYIVIGSYAATTNNIEILDRRILDKIKESYNIINSGVYDKYFTKEDKNNIWQDLNLIKGTNLLD